MSRYGTNLVQTELMRALLEYLLELSLEDGTGGNDRRILRFNNGKTIYNKNS